jgi:transcription antitermination factor NusG
MGPSRITQLKPAARKSSLGNYGRSGQIVTGSAGREPWCTRWYVIRAHQQGESLAVRGLAEQGYRTYLPLLMVRRRDRLVVVPLFGGYAFVAFDRARDPWETVANTRGVLALLNCGGIPTPCENGAVERLQASEAARRSLCLASFLSRMDADRFQAVRRHVHVLQVAE